MSHTCMSHVTCFQTLMARFLVLIESFYTHACVISHTWMSHVTCLLHEWVMSHTWRHTFRYWWIGIGSFPNESCHMSILWLFTSHTWIHRITHMNESCLMSITWMSHVTCMNVSSHTHMNESCHMSITWICHVTHTRMSHVTHTWMSHVLCLSCECVVSHMNTQFQMLMNWQWPFLLSALEHWKVHACPLQKSPIKYTSQRFSAKEPYKRDHILQKRLIISRSLQIVATPYLHSSIGMSMRVRRTSLCGPFSYGLATVSRIDKVIDLFRRMLSLL